MNDEAGFEQLYGGSYKRLVAEVYAFTADLDRAQEAVQEAFIRAWSNWSTVRDLDEPRAWVRRVAMRIAVSRWRRARLAGVAVPLVDTHSVVPGPGPTSVALVQALRVLPLNQRRAVVLHYMCGLTVAEIAAQERTREGTVKSRLARAREALAGLLDDRNPVEAQIGR